MDYVEEFRNKDTNNGFDILTRRTTFLIPFFEFGWEKAYVIDGVKEYKKLIKSVKTKKKK